MRYDPSNGGWQRVFYSDETRLGFKIRGIDRFYWQQSGRDAPEWHVVLHEKKWEGKDLDLPADWQQYGPKNIKLSVSLRLDPSLSQPDRAPGGETAAHAAQAEFSLPRVFPLVYVGLAIAIYTFVAGIEQWPVLFGKFWRAMAFGRLLIGIGASSAVRPRHGRLVAVSVVLASSSAFLAICKFSNVTPNAPGYVLAASILTLLVGAIPALVGLILLAGVGLAGYRMYDEIPKHGLGVVPWQTWVGTPICIGVGLFLVRRQRLVNRRRNSRHP